MAFWNEVHRYMTSGFGRQQGEGFKVRTSSAAPYMTRRGSTQELRHAASSEADHAALLQDDGLNRLTEGKGTSNSCMFTVVNRFRQACCRLQLFLSGAVFFETVTSHSFRQHVVV